MTQASLPDPYAWLEEIESNRALEWVQKRNAITLRELRAEQNYEPTRASLLSLLNSKERIPHFSRCGEQLYNFWQDEQHPRGVWRRTTFGDYRKAQPTWEVLLDVDALNIGVCQRSCRVASCALL
ncbi:hypothetical protein GWC77_25960 [Paraburkholderia sp. NMBU_R16]|uniref:S9 family peptidase n=1 Tax=Paraburkholderia sp. NMBU_R16 TaxID=2698676 RepID=UPI001563A3B8|nr:S9 family peptidase [Paraburkholderia sp. NMBU_R16]NRO99336.1 hypothetical protein [Paraburkholderia sp. NMBU_R16]